VIPSERIERKPPSRPRSGEIIKKLTEAKRLMQLERWSPADASKLRANLDELERIFGVETALKEDIGAIILTSLNEIDHRHYVGGHPPERAYEPAVYKQDMWEFRWRSPFFKNHQMYLKFCLSKGDQDNRRLFMLSIHENRLLQT
jgi:hypothetical protein